MMRLRKTLWLMSASGLVIMSCSPNAQANILPLPSLPDAITSVYNTHFTYTSHPKEMLLSSAFYPLPENSGRVREGFKPTLALPNSLGREKEGVNMSSSGLTRGSRWNNLAALSDLDAPIKLEYDIAHYLALEGRGRHEVSSEGEKIKLASVCFVTDTNDCSGNEFAGSNADDDKPITVIRMTTTSTTPNAAKRKDITKPPAFPVKSLPITVSMTAPILKTAHVLRDIRPANRLITA